MKRTLLFLEELKRNNNLSKSSWFLEKKFF